MDFWEISGQNPIREWMAGLPKDAQAAIDVRLLQMMGMELWSDKWMKKYKNADDLFELRIPFNKVQYRPLCCYGPRRKQLTLLSGAIEKGGRIPRRVVRVAERRLKDLKKDGTRAREHQFD